MNDIQLGLSLVCLAAVCCLGIVVFFCKSKIDGLKKDVTAFTTQLSALSEDNRQVRIRLEEIIESETINTQAFLERAEEIFSQFKNQPEDIFPLVLIFADKINSLENTISKMDTSFKGYKQLKRTVEDMKDQLSEHGFSMPRLLGEPYIEGMRLFADFLDDEDAPEGTRTITKVSKPQVNFRGQMIQSAQVTVTQNLGE